MGLVRYHSRFLISDKISSASYIQRIAAIFDVLELHRSRSRLTLIARVSTTALEQLGRGHANLYEV